MSPHRSVDSHPARQGRGWGRVVRAEAPTDSTSGQMVAAACHAGDRHHLRGDRHSRMCGSHIHESTAATGDILVLGQTGDITGLLLLASCRFSLHPCARTHSLMIEEPCCNTASSSPSRSQSNWRHFLRAHTKARIRPAQFLQLRDGNASTPSSIAERSQSGSAIHASTEW